MKNRICGAVGIALLAAALLAGCAPASAPAPADTAASPAPAPAETSLDLRNTGLTDISALLARTELISLDLRDNALTPAQIDALKAALPECAVRWSVPLGGERFDSESEQLELDKAPEDLAACLAYFPKLTALHAQSAESYAALADAAEAFPDCAFTWEVSLGGKRYAQDTEALDLSGAALTAEALAEALPGLPELTSVELGAEPALSEGEIAALTEAFPKVRMLWDVPLLDGLTVRSDITELDLREYKIADAAAFADRLALLPLLTRADLCGCGPKDEEMLALRARFPHIKFIWYTKVSGWIIRTDIEGFSTGNYNRFPNGGGWYDNVGHHSRVTTESLQNLKYCTDLVALDFGHAKHVEDISFIAELPKLRFLVFSMCAVKDVSALAVQTELEFLEIKNNKITDITPLRNCTKLRFVNCGINGITETDTFLCWPELERLWINVTELTDAQLGALRAARPEVTIIATPYEEHAESAWRKGNEGYLEMQKIFGMRAQHQGSAAAQD